MPGLSRCLLSSPPSAEAPPPPGSARRCASPPRPRAGARAPQARAQPRPALLRVGRGGGAVPRRPSRAPPAPLMNIDASPPRDVAAVPGREPEPPRCWPRGRMRERRQAPSRLPARRLAPQPAGAAQGAASRVEGRRRGGDAAALRGAGGAAAAAAGVAVRTAGLSARRQRQVPGGAGGAGDAAGMAWLRLPVATFPDGGVGRCGERAERGRSHLGCVPPWGSRLRCRPALLRGGTWSERSARLNARPYQLLRFVFAVRGRSPFSSPRVKGKLQLPLSSVGLVCLPRMVAR